MMTIRPIRRRSRAAMLAMCARHNWLAAIAQYIAARDTAPPAGYTMQDLWDHQAYWRLVEEIWTERYQAGR